MGLPHGTVTFLFTDLEGSTRRWEAHPAEMKDALARHNTIVRGAVESHGGVVFSTMGDGMAAVFASAREAVRAVLAAQAGLAAEQWGEVTGPLAARMGLTELVGKSMVVQEEGPDQASRYRLLETMRAYARQQLAAAELGALQRAHAGHYAAFAERAGPELYGPAQLDWQRRIRAELDNLQAAVTWAMTSGGQERRSARGAGRAAGGDGAAGRRR